jgi:hypothetical protein
LERIFCLAAEVLEGNNWFATEANRCCGEDMVITGTGTFEEKGQQAAQTSLS